MCEDGSSSPAGQIASLCLEGSGYDQPHKIFELQGISDIITVMQKTSMEPLKVLQQRNFPVFPSVASIELLQNKFDQRQFLRKRDLPVPSSASVMSVEDILNFAHRSVGSYPIFLKRKFPLDAESKQSAAVNSDYQGLSSSSLGSTLSYNSRSRHTKQSIILYSDDDIVDAIDQLGGDSGNSFICDNLYVEEMISFVCELAVSVVKTKDDQILSYPVVEFHRTKGQTTGTLVICPAQIAASIQQAAIDIAIKAVSILSGVGVFTVELYQLADDAIIVNEILARPHHTGLYTLHGCDRSQYEMHLRAILGLPCSQPRQVIPAVATLQIVASDQLLEAKQKFQQLLSHPGVIGTWYGNNQNKQQIGSRMGHVTLVGHDIYDLRERLELHWGIAERDHHIPAKPSMVAVVIESEASLLATKPALDILENFGISYEVCIISPYKTPTKMFTFAQNAVDRGIKVIITLESSLPVGHLSGILTSLTTLPVLTASMESSTTKSSPSGYPIAFVGVGGLENCAFMAARILALKNASLQQALEEHSIHIEEEVLRESDKHQGLKFSIRK